MTSRTSSAARRRVPKRGSSSPLRHSSSAFTLIELMVVLALLGVLMGISIGAFRRAIPSSEIARNALGDALRQARLFAISENAPSSVRLEPGGPESWPTVSALGRKTVAGWHLEGTDLDGW